MTVVYIDELLFVNFAADYLLLLCAARICAVSVPRARLALGGAAGAVYAAAAVFLHSALLSSAVGKVLAGVLVCLCAFGLRRRTARLTGVFFTAACVFAGFVYALRWLLTGTAGTRPGLFVLLCMLLSATAALLRLLQRSGRRTAGGTRQVRVRLDGRQAAFRALVDTGNSLTDPLSGRAVLVAELECVAELFTPEVRRILACGKDAAGRFEAASRAAPGVRFRLIPFQTVSGASMMTAFVPDALTIDGKKTEHVLIAVSTQRVSDGGAYSALAGDWES